MVSINEVSVSNLQVLESTMENMMEVGVLAQGRFEWCRLKKIFWDDMDDICVFSFVGKGGSWSLPLESITMIRLRDPGFTNEDIL